MVEKWAGDVVSALHINKITQRELAAKMGVTHEYVCMLLGGSKPAPEGTHDRMMAAIEEIKKEER